MHMKKIILGHSILAALAVPSCASLSEGYEYGEGEAVENADIATSVSERDPVSAPESRQLRRARERAKRKAETRQAQAIKE